MDVLAIKLGGSAITKKDEKFSVRKKVLERVAEELASIQKKFFLVHGGGSFGHPLASEYDLTSGYSEKRQLMGFSKTHRAMERLNSKVVEALLNSGQPAVQMQTSACAIVKDERIVSIELQNIQKLLDLGISPVLYGDVVPDLSRGISILSGDQLISFLAQKLEASKVILGTDIKGVFTSDPKRSDKYELIPKITPESWEKISHRIDFYPERDETGGMKNKVDVLIDLAKRGIESQIINLKKPGNLKQAILTDKRIGTKITRE